MHDSLDLDAIREQRPTNLRHKNYKERHAVNVSNTTKFIACVHDLVVGAKINAPSYLTQGSRVGNPRIFYGFIIAVFASTVLVPGRASALIYLAFLLWAFGGTVLKAMGLRGTRDERQLARHILQLMVVLVPVLIGIQNLYNGLLSIILGESALVGWVSFALAMFTMLVLLFLPTIVILRGPFARGDYTKARQLVDWLPSFAVLWLYEGLVSWKSVISLYAGDYEQTYALAKDTLVNEPARLFISKALSFGHIADALLSMGRYDEALPLIECFCSSPVSGTYPLILLVDYYDLQDIEPERSLEITQILLDTTPKPRFQLFGLNWHREQVVALHAKMLARNGRFDEARETIHPVVVNATRVQPFQAYRTLRAGEIEVLAGQPDRARPYFEETLTLDPDGRSGQRARQALLMLDS